MSRFDYPGSMKVGIVGLPNVGKSTLFNALTRSHRAEAANYPFCTIEPNVGIVQVPDRRLAFLQRLVHTTVVIPATVEFVDIAGLVAGASKGEGLGNKFLSHIREMDALVHVVRCFEDGNVLHTSGAPDAGRDLEIIQTELLLADLESVGNQVERNRRRAKGPDKEAQQMVALGERLLAHLNGGNPAHSLPILEGEEGPLKKFCLLTAKPILYACNVGADDLGKHASNPHVGAVRDYARDHPPARIVEVSVQLEEELAHLSPEEARQFLDGLGVGNGGMEELIRCCYELLDLASFFTAGEKEVRAWTFRRGMKAPACAGIIHGDFEKGFIKAEVVSCGDLEKFGSMGEARAAGRYRLEGKDYEFQDGDVAIFRFN